MRLELKNEQGKLRAEIFQFHKGAIRTLDPRGANASALRFQFHKGAIRTRHP